MQGPEPYLTKLKVRLMCPVEPDKPARIAPSLRYQLNHEIYFFSGKAALETFRRNPLPYCGRVTDPVSRERFRPTAASPKVLFGGRLYYFGNDANRVRFQALPDSFAVRRGA